VLHSMFELPQEPIRFILVLHSTFKHHQEPTRFVLTCQAGSVELLFMFADQCLCVNKTLN